jgi:hypothetical protein
MRISSLGSDCIHFIYKNKPIYSDFEISKLLNITYQEYYDIIIFNKGYLNNSLKLVFSNPESCEKCIEYIREKYNNRLVYLKLTE